MPRCAILACCLALAAVPAAGAQSISVYQTTPDLLEALSQRQNLHFSSKPEPGQIAPLIAVDDGKRFQEIDGFGASLTDSAAWLFAKKLSPEQTDNACATPAGATDPDLAHYSLAHDQEYIPPLLKKALALNPAIHVMLTPWSPPGWMKKSGSMLGSNPETKEPSSLRPEFYPALARYLVKTVEGYQAAGVPVYALSVQNEPLYAPPTYSGMRMLAEEQAAFLGDALGPAMAAASLKTKVMVYDHNWDRPDYPETVLKDPKAGALAAGTAWHHYAGDPSVMTKFHDEFPQKDQWVTESSGGVWQKGNVLTDEAPELIAVTRNWAKSYVLWALATDTRTTDRMWAAAAPAGDW